MSTEESPTGGHIGEELRGYPVEGGSAGKSEGRGGRTVWGRRRGPGPGALGRDRITGIVEVVPYLPRSEASRRSRSSPAPSLAARRPRHRPAGYGDVARGTHPVPERRTSLAKRVGTGLTPVTGRGESQLTPGKSDVPRVKHGGARRFSERHSPPWAGARACTGVRQFGAAVAAGGHFGRPRNP